MQICVRIWFNCVVVYVEYWLSSPSLWSISSFCPFCHPFWDHFPGDTRRDILHSSFGRMHPKDRTWSRRSYTSSCADCCEECKVAMGLSGPECKPFSSCQSIASSANHAWETWTRGAVFIKGKSIYILYFSIFFLPFVPAFLLFSALYLTRNVNETWENTIRSRLQKISLLVLEKCNSFQ